MEEIQKDRLPELIEAAAKRALDSTGEERKAAIEDYIKLSKLDSDIEIAHLNYQKDLEKSESEIRLKEEQIKEDKKGRIWNNIIQGSKVGLQIGLAALVLYVDYSFEVFGTHRAPAGKSTLQAIFKNATNM